VLSYNCIKLFKITGWQAYWVH